MLLQHYARQEGKLAASHLRTGFAIGFKRHPVGKECPVNV